MMHAVFCVIRAPAYIRGRIFRSSSGSTTNPSGADEMNSLRIFAIVLIVAGSLGLAYGGFSYTRETTAMKLGSMELKVQERETVGIPLLVSAGAIVAGIILLVGAGRSK
jgi:hypothetical protein